MEADSVLARITLLTLSITPPNIPYKLQTPTNALLTNSTYTPIPCIFLSINFSALPKVHFSRVQNYARVIVLLPPYLVIWVAKMRFVKGTVHRLHRSWLRSLTNTLTKLRFVTHASSYPLGVARLSQRKITSDKVYLSTSSITQLC